jgi:ComEC/Rec2-related protein
VPRADVQLRLTLPARGGPEARELFESLMDTEALGYLVEADVRWRAPEPPLNPGAFDQEQFLAQEGVVTRVSAPVARVRILERARGNLFWELALAAKRRLLDVYRAVLPDPAIRLVAGATLGLRGGVREAPYREFTIEEMFRRAGVGHVLAVSGLHVSVVSLLLFWLFHSSGLRPRTYAPALVFFLLLFAVITGARPSSMRAVIMNAAVICAYAYLRCGLRAAAHGGLALSALLILFPSPLLLFAPSFALSYGAVLSLVLISPVLDRRIRRLRGFSLAWGGLWTAGALAGAALRPDLAARPAALAGAAGALWLGMLAAGRLNLLFPAAWRVGIPGPPALRMLVSAQFAIQLGMMIPLSAWYFGRFPLAGVLVNIPAIPLIGVVIQLGLLTGLIGLVPLAGVWLALPLGAAAAVAADLFLWLAWWGAHHFPCFAVARPSPSAMVFYYAALGALLLLDAGRHRVRAACARAGPRIAAVAAAAAAILLAGAPLLRSLAVPERTEAVTCLAAGDAPLLAVTRSRGDAVVLNAGDRYSGVTLFDVLRTRGAVEVHTAVLASSRPQAGTEGLTALAARMRVRRCLLPAAPDNPDDLLPALGDPWLLRQAQANEAWALNYPRAYAALRAALAPGRAAVEEIPAGRVAGGADWELFAVRGEGRAVLLDLRVRGFRWLVFTDTSPPAAAALARLADPRCDVLVLPRPGSARGEEDRVAGIVRRTAPRAVVVSGGRRFPGGGDTPPVAQASSGILFDTARDGAVTATFGADGGMRIESLRSGLTFVLTPSQEPPRPL